MRASATEDEIQHVIDTIEEIGLKPHVSRGQERTIIGAIGDESKLRSKPIESFPGVDTVQEIQKPYKLASRQMHPENTLIDVNGIEIGGDRIVIVAGPCSVEGQEKISEVALAVKDAGASMLRGGAFKPRTSPYSFQGMGEEGLKCLAQARQETGLPVVTEVMDPRQVELVNEYADVFQIGARNVQNYDLLKEVGLTRRPVLLKRGMSTTLKELLMSAEYIMAGGNKEVILCERGIRTFETAMRNTLDVAAVAWLKRESHLPVFVDPSHAAGIYRFVEPLALAAVACGADGLLIEVHQDPENAFSDGAQSLLPSRFERMFSALELVAKAIGRTI